MALTERQLAAYARDLRLNKEITVREMSRRVGIAERSIHRGERGLQLSATIALIIELTGQTVEERITHTATESIQTFRIK